MTSAYLLGLSRNDVVLKKIQTESGQLNKSIGELIRWPCDSDQLQLGDTIYLVRQGAEPRGIIAEGEVTQALYHERENTDSPIQKTYIQFRLKSLRTSCRDGLLATMLLQSAMPDQTWNSSKAVVEIKPNHIPLLAELWKQGDGVHSLQQYFLWYKHQDTFPNDWYDAYRQKCELVEQIKEGKSVTDEDIRQIWFERDGVAGVGQGFMSSADFAENLEFLRDKTKLISVSPTEETYQKLTNEWKIEGTFKRMLWVVIHRVFATAAPEKYTSIVDNNYLRSVFRCLAQQFQLSVDEEGSWLKRNEALLSAIADYFDNNWDYQTRNILLWSLYEWEGLHNDSSQSSSIIENDSEDLKVSLKYEGLNQILYGPPGTGKTYLTIEQAVRCAEPDFIWKNRQELKDKYNQLIKEKRIRFVTFHQSFGYEEFIEGLSALAENEAVTYAVKSGIFKQICIDAKINQNGNSNQFETVLEKLKEEADEQFVSLKTLRGKEFKFIYRGDSTFRIYPSESKNEHLENGYGASIDNLRNLYITDDTSNIYNPSYVKAILAYMKDKYLLADYNGNINQSNHKNYVLIIDEINRGNISKIFGELITLIEPSKRSGSDEALEVTLPYSGEKFSVPDNLYIIGTMNTADRSLTMMDTALRRRFEFVEMMPKPALLGNAEVNGINLTQLLKRLNERIAVLYDREHTLGHAFFMPVKELIDSGENEAAFSKLVSVFKNKIIPLLQEYFFDDWQKIRLVLGDNQRTEDLQFIEEEMLYNSTLNDFFGEQHNLNAYGDELKQYTLKEFGDNSVWCKPDAYIGIYDPKPIDKSENQEQINEG